VLDVRERNLETDVFKMIRYCLLGDKKGGFRIYLDLLCAGEDTGRITGTISWHARMALMIKILMEQQCYDIPSRLEQSGIKSGAYFFWKDIISEISFQKIKKYAVLVEDIEYRIKTGKIPEDAGLEMLLSKM
jgi:DNA polymerase III delta subunit